MGAGLATAVHSRSRPPRGSALVPTGGAGGFGYPVRMLPAQTLLETLPGWPAAQDPTALEMLFLTVMLPVGIAAVFAVLVLAPGWRRGDET